MREIRPSGSEGGVVSALPHQESYLRPSLLHSGSYRSYAVDWPPPAVSYSHVSSEAANPRLPSRTVEPKTRRKISSEAAGKIIT
jgi:hypothetical protein